MEKTMTHLKGKHALVTGGGTGIGQGIAVMLSKLGATVTITGRRIETLTETCSLADNIFPIVMDMASEESVITGTKSAISERGPTLIHVANAGIAETMPVHKMELAFWNKIMRTNLDGVFLGIREALPGMREHGYGRIITISSIAGLKGLKYGAAYSASKHAIIGLTKTLSEEYMSTGITANAICPGYVRTPIVDRNRDLIASRSNLTNEQAEKSMSQDNRHKRLIEVNEITCAAEYLVNQNSESINGQTLEIAGGQI
jgi:NAD(P)-dependent dehydrogenase (short-subunit alcohol dehydrogenase family)